MPPSDGDGRLEPDGSLATLRFERFYRHAIEHVWDAISTPEGLAGWLVCSRAVIDWIARFTELMRSYPEWTGHAD